MATVTIQTRLVLTPPQAAVLAACAERMGQAQRHLHTGRLRGQTVAVLKAALCRKFGLTARQFNGLRVDYDGKLRSARAGQRRTRDRLDRQREHNTDRLTRARALLHPDQKTTNAPGYVPLTPAKRRHTRRTIHTLNRRGVDLTARAATAEVALEGPPSLCFGGRRLFRAQYDLAANGFADHAAWKTAWQEARSAQCFFVGSKDETAGNQSAQFDPAEGTLTIRLPEAVAAAQGVSKWLVLPVRWAQDPALLPAALMAGVAISYRIVRTPVTTRGGHHTGAVQWRVFATTTRADAPVVTDPQRGAIGVDLNVDHVAWARVDRDGNPVDYGTIPLQVVGRRQAQVAAAVSAATQPLVKRARAQGVPLVLETLDLSRRTDQRRGGNRKSNRRLGAFAYRAIEQHVASQAARAGVQVVPVNPAFTSVIGEHKYAAGYGLSRHLAAAVVIGRRGLQDLGRVTPDQDPRQIHVRIMRERLRGRSAGPGSTRSACALPDRDRTRHVWSDWGRFARTLAKAAEVARKARAARVARAGGESPEDGARRRDRGGIPPARSPIQDTRHDAVGRGP